MMRCNFSLVFAAAVVGAAVAGPAGYWLGRKAVARPMRTAKAEMNRNAPAERRSAAPTSAALSGPSLTLTAADREAERRQTFLTLSAAELEKRAERLLAERSSPRRDRELRLALELLARHDAARALALAGREENGPVRTMLITGVVAGWMVGDPVAALAWAARAGNPEFADAAFEQIAAFDPSRAMELVSGLAAVPQEFRWNAWRAVVEGRLFEGEYGEARAVVDGAVEEELKLFLAGAVADAWVRTDPAAALRWVMTMPAGEQQTQMLLRLGSIWAAGDPETAANFATSLPTGAPRQEMLTHVLSEWVTRDLAAASRWADRLGPARENDVAIVAIATDAHLARVNPVVALSWAESVVDAAARRQALTAIVKDWAQREPARARAYVESAAGLGGDERAHLMTTLEAPPMAE